MMGDWKSEAMEYRDVDRAAQAKAEAEIAAQKLYQDAITGADPKATAKLVKALRAAWKLP